MAEQYPYRFVATDWRRSIVLWWKVPLVWKWFAFSRHPTMYVNDPDDPFEIEHEYGHVVWLWEKGWFTFYWRYLTSESFRCDAECYSNARRIKMMVDGGGFDLTSLINYWGAMTALSYRLEYTAEYCIERIRWYHQELQNA